MKTSFLQTGISTAALSLSAAAAFAADGRPNILYIMSDDHSFQTIGVYASVLKDYVKTPNIDRIANEGVKMENCFVTNLCGWCLCIRQADGPVHLPET